MSGEQVSITFTAEQNAAINAWNSQQKLADGLLKKLDTLGKAGKKAGKDTEDGFGGAAAMAGKFVVSLTGIGSVISGIAAAANVLRSEYDNLIRREKSAADAQLGYAPILRGLIGNVGVDPKMNAQQVEDRAAAGALAASVPAETYGLAASAAMSSKGSLSAEQAFQATDAAVRLVPDDRDAAIAGASANAMLMQKGVTAEQAAGFGVGVGQSASVRSPKFISENVTPAIVALTSFGDDLREAGVIVSTITQGLNDVTGAQSKTTAISLGQQLKERFPEEADFTARIRRIQNDTKAQKLVFEGGKNSAGEKFSPITLEMAARPMVEELLTNSGSRMGGIFNKVSADLAAPEDSAQIFRDFSSGLDSSKILAAEKRKRQYDAANQNMELRDSAGAMASITQEGFQDTLVKAKVSSIDQWKLNRQFEFNRLTGGDSDEFAAGKFKEIAAYKMRDTEYLRTGPVARTPSTEDNRIYDSLERIAKLLLEGNQTRKTVAAEVAKPAAPVPPPRREHGSVKPSERKK